MNTGAVWRALAPAKVNLHLTVQGRRADGFHAIETWMLAIDLCDEIAVRADESGSVTIAVLGPAASADVPGDARNLAAGAAELVLRRARDLGRARAATGLALVLTKNIPSQSGLGGASADTAAAYLAATRALGLEPDRERTRADLATLGSDTVFFAEGGAGLALCTGRGERVEEVAEPGAWHLVLLVPDVGCPTPLVYRWFREHQPVPVPGRHLPRSAWALGLDALRPSLRNELAPAARAAIPSLEPWFSILASEFPGQFRLSGSGSAFFGIFEGPQPALECLRSVERVLLESGLPPRILRLVRPAGHVAKVL